MSSTGLRTLRSSQQLGDRHARLGLPLGGLLTPVLGVGVSSRGSGNPRLL
jgi:hypothetical protein